MTAFGPYKDQETIDFTQLKDNRLFVIAGNTGAGKTTIFDGICFALYGSASGQDRDKIQMLRSDFADDDIHTSVELEFMIKGRTYRILRQLGHVKQGNKSKTGERYEFVEQKKTGEIPCVDRQIVSEIDRKVEALIGLTREQFIQIVMLPQGEFRKLLTSKTENKEEILRRLFKTDTYKQITEKLRIKKDEALASFQRTKQTYDHYVSQIKAVLPCRDNSSLTEVLNSEHINVNQIVKALDAELLYYRDKIHEDEKRYQTAYNVHHQKQAEFHQAQTINEALSELEEKRTRLNALNDEKPLYQEKEKTLETAKRARQIEPYEKQLLIRRQAEEVKKNSVKAAELAKAQCGQNLKQAEATYEKEQNKQTERDSTRRQIERLREFIPVVEAFAQTEKELNTLHDTKQEKEKHLQQLNADLNTAQVTLEKTKASLNTLEQIPEHLSDKKIKRNELREQAKVLRDFIDMQTKHRQLTEAQLVKRTAFEKARRQYERLEAGWLQSHAELLASKLHAGEACPVCGSRAHPHKADTVSEGVSKNSLEQAKKEFDLCDEQFRNAKADLHATSELLKEKQSAVRVYVTDENEASRTYDELVVIGKQLTQDIIELEAAQKKRITLKREVEQLENQYKMLQEKSKGADKALQHVQSDYQTKLALYKERINQIPEAYRKADDLNQAISNTERHQKQLEALWEKAQNELLKAQQALTKAESDLLHYEKQVEETTQDRLGAEKQFNDMLQQRGFIDVQSYEQAKLPEDQCNEMEQSINVYKQSCVLLKEQTAELAQKLEGQEKVDLVARQNELQELLAAYETAFKAWKQSEDYYREAQKLLDHITEANSNVEKAEQQLARLTDLYNIIRGQNAHKVSFERYLQIEYLEQIIAAANERLRYLSSGQFYLMRSDRQESHGRQSGLGLDIYDAYTGQNRDVKTLSGGEKFNASLCLALGMSDVIQSFQGGISIETMFIDEGFGTLDEESLHKAIDTLVDLQQTGRTIGVISHVQELKTIFPAVLEVVKMKEGVSRTQFKVQ